MDISIICGEVSMSFNVNALKPLDLNERIEIGKSAYMSTTKSDVVPDKLISAFGEAFEKIDFIETEEENVIIHYPPEINTEPIDESTEEPVQTINS